MKSISKKLVGCIAGATFVAFTLASSFSASAQDKPKGKPWPAPESAVKMKNPVKADENSVRAGKDIYAQQCRSCHGSKGKGDGPKADKLDISCGDFTSEDVAKQSDGALYWKITEGRKPMPSFKDKLGDQDRWQVVNYLRTLAKAK